jgi:hypothetical protein
LRDPIAQRRFWRLILRQVYRFCCFVHPILPSEPPAGW